jgi:hypothetical protein
MFTYFLKNRHVYLLEHEKISKTKKKKNKINEEQLLGSMAQKFPTG